MSCNGIIRWDGNCSASLLRLLVAKLLQRRHVLVVRKKKAVDREGWDDIAPAATPMAKVTDLGGIVK